VYIQDIDTNILKKENIDKIIDDFRKQSGRDLRKNNKFIITIGTLKKTNLPDHTFDLIYSNATVHSFTSLDSIVVDLGRKLKTNGVLFFRDGFKKDQDIESYCPDPKCRRPLLTIDEFLATMKRNGFELKKQSSNMSGYPILGFTWTGN
jgi:SAM-dependent methyltransferase